MNLSDEFVLTNKEIYLIAFCFLMIGICLTGIIYSIIYDHQMKSHHAQSYDFGFEDGRAQGKNDFIIEFTNSAYDFDHRRMFFRCNLINCSLNNNKSLIYQPNRISLIGNNYTIVLVEDGTWWSAIK